MPAGLVLGLLASVGWGFTDIAAAIGGRRVGSLRVLVGAGAASLLVLVCVAASDPSRLPPTTMPGVATGIVLGVGSAVAYLAAFTALRIGPLSVVSPVIAAYGGATVVLAVLVRGESLLPMQALGAVVATAGVTLAGVTFRDGRVWRARVVGPGVVFAVIALSLFALLTVALAGPIQEHGWLPVVLGSRLGYVVTSLALLAGAHRAGGSAGLDKPRAIGARFEGRSVALVVAVGVTDAAAFVSYAVGLEVSFAWLVGLSSSFGPIIPLLFAVGRFGERLSATQWLGLGLIAVGLVVLALTA